MSFAIIIIWQCLLLEHDNCFLPGFHAHILQHLGYFALSSSQTENTLKCNSLQDFFLKLSKSMDTICAVMIISENQKLIDSLVKMSYCKCWPKQ